MLLSLQSQPWRRKERRERKPVPEAGGAIAKIRAPGRGCPSQCQPTTAALDLGSSALASGKLKPQAGGGAESAQTPLLRKWGVGKVGLVWSPRTGGEASWRMRGQEKGRKCPRQLLNIWSHRELITQRPGVQWGW
jgi:hypothetical protein